MNSWSAVEQPAGGPEMKSLYAGALVILAAALSLAPAQSANQKRGDREKLIGAWHLVHIESPGTNANEAGSPQPAGMLIYSRDGHFSVQLMYPQPEHDLNNQYVREGYEASFGSYDMDEATHTLTHHVQGSNTGDLIVGKNLPRIYQFTKDGRLIIRPAQSDERWSVVWERY
jgi:Lipocalin-like domain